MRQDIAGAGEGSGSYEVQSVLSQNKYLSGNFIESVINLQLENSLEYWQPC